MGLKRTCVAIWALLSTAELGAAIKETTQASYPNCTTNSFTIPSWFIKDFRSESNKASFGVYNRASDSTYALQCQSADSIWSCTGSDDPSLEISLHVKPSSAAVAVKQSWSCSDRNPAKPLLFSASGNTTIPLTCASSSSSCKSANPIDLVKGTLSSPISNVTPSYAEGPDGHDTPGCVASSKEPEWSVKTVIYFNETSQDQSFAIQTQSIQFQLVNYATGYVAGCLNYFGDLGESEDAGVVINCGGNAGFGLGDRYSISTKAVFYPRIWKLSVEQTWFCDDVDAARPIQVSATGNTTLPLQCTQESPTTKACQTPLANLTGSVLTSTSLLPYSLTDPLPPTSDGCTLSSVISPSFLLSNLEVAKNVTSFSTEPTTSQPGDISFNMKLYTDKNSINSFFDFPIFVTTAPGEVVDLMSQDLWYTCTFGPGEIPLAPKSCQFQYRNGDGLLKIKVEWVCIDLDGGKHPVLFRGTAVTSLPELECGIGPTGLSVCSSSEGYSWISKVDDVSWRTLDGLARV